jgi:3-oxoacyl-[acyl-carrier protein] reductase
MDDLDFTGRNVLVVGGSSGIGNGIAHAFRKRGATVCVWGTRRRAEDYLDVEGSDLGGLEYQAVDVASAESLAAADRPFRHLDILVLAQGTVLYRREEFTREGFAKVLAVNLQSLMACANKFHEQLAERQGSMIIVSSAAAYHATRGNPAYGASKAAAVSLTATLGEAWAAQGVKVNGIAPGLVDTKLTKVTTGRPDRLARTLEKIPLGRLGTPEDMAGVALFLASPLAAYIVGQTILVDGGILLS